MSTPRTFATLPKLDRLSEVRHENDGTLTLLVQHQREQRCDDDDCTLIHKIDLVDYPYRIQGTADELAAIGEHYITLALGDFTSAPEVPTDATAIDSIVDTLRFALEQNIAGVSASERNTMQAVAPVVARLIYRLAGYADTALTRDRIE